MSAHTRLRALWRSLFRKGAVERELDDELTAFVELLTAEKVNSGLAPAAARRAALIEVGGVEQVKEEVRQVRMGTAVESVMRDLKYGVRALLRNPGFATAAMVALALGIGASVAIFSVVNGVLLRPLPYAEPERLVVVLHHGTDPVSPANFADWRRLNSTFERMGAAEYWTPNLTGEEAPESVLALRITGDVLPLLGVRPALGRLFLPEEEDPGRDRAVVLSDGLWHRRFAGDSGVVGRTVALNGEPYTVVGVMPAGFGFAPFWATGAELWAPLALAPRANSRGGNSLRVFARLRAGTTLEAARSDIAGITARLDREFPGSNTDVRIIPLTERVVGNIRPILLVLFGAVGFVLLIACANVAHMLLARAAARQKEVSVRTALGASRARIVRQLLVEGLLLSLGGGAIGLLLAWVAVRGLVAFGPASIPRLDSISLDWTVAAFTLAVSLATGVAFGLAPVWHATRTDLSAALRDRGPAGGGARHHRLRGVLVGSEFALALVLLVGAGLMVRTMAALQRVDPGFRAEGVLSAVVSLAGAPSAAPERRGPFYDELVRQVAALPGVTAASGINHLPIAGDHWGMPFVPEGKPRPRPGEAPTATYRVVMPEYFATMGIPVLRGRDVTAADRLDGPPVVVINQRLAELHWPGEDPIGKRLTLGEGGDGAVWHTVVGVVKNTVRSEWAAPAGEEVFLPLSQNQSLLRGSRAHESYLTLVLRTSGDPAEMAPAVRQMVRSLDRQALVRGVETMAAVVARANAGPRFYLAVFSSFAAIALVLAAVGIYGVMSYAVSLRRLEIGIRLALGADRRDIERMVVGQGMRVAAIGGAVGLLAAFGLTRFMGRLLYGVGVADALTFSAVALALAVVAFGACYLPARRATGIDPLRAIRAE
ncbi:MAG: ABC transporter permease [Gemmatimonadales bacterium]|nr:ABC transporter permease [Gemmatimonadales bacterium]